MNKSSMIRNASCWSIAVLAILAGGCRSNKTDTVEKKPAIFFPKPPLAPRIQYVTSFGLAEHVKEGKKSSLRDFLLGDQDKKDELGLKKATGIAVHDGVVYVCDTNTNSVNVFDFKKKTYSAFGTERGEGLLAEPVNIAVDDLGYKFVTDTIRQQVVIFDAENKFASAFSLPKDTRPVDVAVHGNEIFVLDCDRTSQILVLDRQSGKVLRTIGGPGQKPGKFNFPVSLDIDDKGFIYVSDMLNFRIQKLASDGTPIWAMGQAGRRLGEFARPRGIVVGEDGIVYIIDTATERVQMFNEKGQLLMGFSGPGNVPGTLDMPKEIAVDKSLLEVFRKDINPDFNVEYLILVTNLLNRRKVNVFAFGAFPPGYKAGKEIKALPTPGAPKENIFNPEDPDKVPGGTPPPGAGKSAIPALPDKTKPVEPSEKSEKP